MTTDYATLEVGQTVSSRTFPLDAETVAKYVEAVDDRSMPWGEGSDGLAPPMAVVALALRGVIDDLGIPSGTVHAGQELEAARAVRVGQTVECKATVAQNSVRSGARFLALSLSVAAGGRTAMSGKSTLVLPA